MVDLNAENMELRTLYPPLEIGRQLKALAFTRDVSKGELMRELIMQGLAAIAASGERSLSERIAAQFATRQAGTAVVKWRTASRARRTS
jgi:superfamily II DNA or RNA helicase